MGGDGPGESKLPRWLKEREVEGDVLRNDMGHGVPFRPGVFDGCVSISAVQWLCNADNSAHVPQRRLKKFFTQLYKCLKRAPRRFCKFIPTDRDKRR